MSQVDIGGWYCHVCGHERPDDKISVHKRAHRMGEQNIRYCNDRRACIDNAPRVTFFAITKPGDIHPAAPIYD